MWHQLFQSTWPMNYICNCLNLLSLHIGVSGKHSGQALCPQASVCPELAALALFTPWVAPVSSFLERGGARVTASAYTSDSPFPSSCSLCICGVPLSTESTSARCQFLPCGLLQHPWVMSLTPNLFVILLGIIALGERDFGTGINSFWRRMK